MILSRNISDVIPEVFAGWFSYFYYYRLDDVRD